MNREDTKHAKAEAGQRSEAQRDLIPRISTDCGSLYPQGEYTRHQTNCKIWPFFTIDVDSDVITGHNFGDVASPVKGNSPLDLKLFGQNKTGELVQIYVPEPEWAFIPAPLPPAWEFPAHLWPILNDATSAVSKLDGIGRTLPDPQLLLTPLKHREALTSSSLEGTYATAEELMLYDLDPVRPKSDRDKANDWREVWNYNKALNEGYAELVRLPLCLRLIRTLHRSLMEGVRGKDKTPGEFRKHQVHIGSDRRYVPPPPERLMPCLDELEKYVNSDDSDDPKYHPLVRCYLIHYQFEAIHPFSDGNGRVGRLLLALMVYKWLDLSMPWLYMSAFFERYKDEYISNLFRISTEGDWNAWIEFCLRGTIRQANDAILRCDALRNLRDQLHSRAGTGSARTHQIVESLFSQPVLRITDLAKRFKVTYHTARSDLEYLSRCGVLREMEGSKVKTFFAPEILAIAYAENHSL